MKVILIMAILMSQMLFASDYDTVVKSLNGKIVKSKKLGNMPVIVFDIDHTLIDSSPRIRKILKDASKKYYSKDLIKFLKDKNNDKFSFRYRTIRNLLIDLKIKTKKMEKILKYVDSKFFLSEYTQYDVVLSDSLRLVKEFYKKGAFIIYLTARGKSSLVGTIASLDRLGFPIGRARTSLIMKLKGEKSALYKKNSLMELSTMGDILAVFDDKVTNLEGLTPFLNKNFSLYLVNSKTKNKKISTVILN